MYKLNKLQGLELYVDADFAGGWTNADAGNTENVMSRTGYVIMYAGCPIFWSSKLQIEVALSTAEAEYIAMSQATRVVLPMIELMKEIQNIVNLPDPDFGCIAYEDNKKCIAIEKFKMFTLCLPHM